MAAQCPSQMIPDLILAKSSYMISYKKIAELDCNIMLWIARKRTPSLVLFFKLMTYSAIGRVWFVFAIILNALNYLDIQLIEQQTVFLKALLAPLATWILGKMIKKYFKRKRPFQCIPNYTSLVKSPLNDSFLSLHAGSTFSLFTSLLILQHPLAYWIGIWAILVSFSRLYLGVHFLSDILAGILLGILCGSIY